MAKILTEKNSKVDKKRLFADFLSGEGSIGKYLRAQNIREVVNKDISSSVDRNLLCDILEKQNKSYKAKSRTFESINRLRLDKTLCIFAGQQSGLYGGPLYTLYKAIDVIKRAEIMTQKLARPVVPVFWIAADDHDFEEINHTWFINREGNPERIIYDSPPDEAIPVADICFEENDGYQKLKEQTEAAFGGTDFSDEIFKRLFEAYKSGHCFSRAFGQYMADILPDLGLIFFCPSEKEVKNLSKNFFKKLTERFFQFKPILEETESSLETDGYHIQVRKKPTALHLFYHDPDRKPIHYMDDTFHLEEKRLALPAMLDLIERNPEKFSPDVLTRPLWQSYLFPVLAQTGGPSEIAYFCQIGGLFKIFDLQQPTYYARLTASLVEKRAEEFFARYEFSMDDLTGDIEQLINRIALRSFPQEIEKRFEEFRSKLENDFEDFMSFMQQHEKNLDSLSKQTYGKIDFALNNLEKKVFAQHKKKMQDIRNQIYRMTNLLYPEHTPQERLLNINYFISKYGFGVVDFIIEKLDIKNKKHQLINLSEFTG